MAQIADGQIVPGENEPGETAAQPGSNAALDQIEAEALAMAGAPGAADEPGADQAGAKPDPEPQPQHDPAAEEKAFKATSDLAAAGCIMACKKLKFVFGAKPEGISDERWEIIKTNAVAVFGQPMFQEIVVPVLKKYNITIYNIPPEFTMIGGLVYMVIQMKEILQHEINSARKEQTRD